MHGKQTRQADSLAQWKLGFIPKPITITLNDQCLMDIYKSGAPVTNGAVIELVNLLESSRSRSIQMKQNCLTYLLTSGLSILGRNTGTSIKMLDEVYSHIQPTDQIKELIPNWMKQISVNRRARNNQR